MARAGRNAHKHVASQRRDGSATPAAAPRHKAPRRWQASRLAGPVVLTLSLAGTVVAYEVSDDEVTPEPSAPTAIAPVDLSVRTAQVSRSISRAVSRTTVRPLTTARRVVLQPTAVDHEFATEPLTLRRGPGADTEQFRTVPTGARLAVTGQVSDGWAEVLVRAELPARGKGRERTPARTVTVVRWVEADHLAERKPQPEPEPEETTSSSSDPSASTTSATTTSGVSGAPCPDGSTIESGITSSAVRLYRAVCAAFPSLTTYGGYDPHGEHIDGRAIDFMVSGPLGQAVADYVLANAGTLGVRDIIWAQRIWTPEQASSGWRWMEDRGSTTANHYDHVHVAVF